MATTDFSLSRNEVIRQALLKIGAIDSDEGASAQELKDANQILGAIINRVATRTNVFPKFDLEFSLTPGTESYTVKSGGDVDTPKPFQLYSCRSKNSTDGTEIPIDVVSRQEYMNLPTKNTQGAPNIVYYHPKAEEGLLYVWPTGDSTYDTLVLTFQRPLEVPTTTSDTLDFPQEWYDVLIYQLAEELAPQYIGSLPGWLAQKSQQLLREMYAHDTGNESLRIVPNMHSYRWGR